MRSKISLCLVILFTVLSISCDKKSDEILAMLQEIKQQNTDLKVQVTNLQKTTDSLSAALKLANQNISSMDKKIDSIRNQLSSMVTQINSLSVQLTQANVNIADLQKRISELQAKCQELVDLLRLLTGTMNLSDGLVAYYPFTGNANDSSGFNNNGNLFGPTLSTDRFGNLNSAYKFNGINNYIEVNHSSSLTFPKNTQSISFWMNSASYTTSVQLINKYSGAGATTSGFFIDFDLGTSIKAFTYRYGVNPTVSSLWGGTGILISSLPPQNTWVHVTVVANNGIDYMYIGGKLVSNSAPHKNIIGSNTNPLRIGVPSNSLVNNYYNGLLDDIRIYNRALTEQEITYLATH